MTAKAPAFDYACSIACDSAQCRRMRCVDSIRRPRAPEGDQIHALSLLRQSRHAGLGFAADRLFVINPPSPRLSGLRWTLHDLRARPVARTHGDQEIGPPRALWPRQAGALGADRPA